VRIFKTVSQKASKHILECIIMGVVSVSNPRLSNADLPVFPLALFFGSSPAFLRCRVEPGGATERSAVLWTFLASV